MPILTTLGLLFVTGLCGGLLVGCEDTSNKDDKSATLGGDGNPNPDVWKKPGMTQGAGDGIANQGADSISGQNEAEDKPAVEGALVVCTCMQEKASESKMIVENPAGRTILQGKPQLGHLDIHFKNVFKGCKTRGGGSGSCVPEIEGEQWQSVNSDQMNSDDNKTVYIEHSYMFCTAGGGMIFVDEDGQIKGEEQGLSMMFFQDLDRKILEYYVNEKTLAAMGWTMADFKKAYGANAIEELRKWMREYGIMHPESIKMFLATLGEESENGTRKTEYIADDYSTALYNRNTRGAGLIQVTGGAQADFLNYIWKRLPAGEEKDAVKRYIDGFVYTSVNKDIRVTNNLDVTEYISKNYPIEASTWFWAQYKKVGNVNGDGSLQFPEAMTINDFLSRQLKKENNNLYNTFAVSQMLTNGTVYGPDVLERICEYDQDIVIKVKSSSSTGCQKNNPKDGCGASLFCLTVPDEPARHSYGPRGWPEREADWFVIDKMN